MFIIVQIDVDTWSQKQSIDTIGGTMLYKRQRRGWSSKLLVCGWLDQFHQWWNKVLQGCIEYEEFDEIMQQPFDQASNLSQHNKHKSSSKCAQQCTWT